jgi:MtfA peptidase
MVSMAGILSLIVLAAIALFLFLFTKLPGIRKRNKILKNPFPKEWENILEDKVSFYRTLSDIDKIRFCGRVKIFLSEVRITGVEVEVTDTLKLLVACSAIIPVFAFENWDYVNLGEVLIYNGLVETNLVSETDNHHNILGQVRPFQSRHLLLLSKQSLEEGFEKMNSKENVGFHEFAHLLDEADGAIDGIPKALMATELIEPWTRLMYKEIERIKEGRSDINPYGLTNHAEFFAVVCEYFFEDHVKFKKNHEELYSLLIQIFSKK